jgi:NAD dependent epimerase/dehydratase family enzyme
MSELFLASQRVDPVVARAFQFEYRHASLESALEAVEEDRS